MVISSYASNYGYHKRCTCVYHEKSKHTPIVIPRYRSKLECI